MASPPPKNFSLEDLKEATEALNAKTNRNTSLRSCVKHPERELDFYCASCRSIVCPSCFVEDHNSHDGKEVAVAAVEFRRKLEANSGRMADHKARMMSKKLDMERRKKEFLTETTKTENGVQLKSQHMKMLIDQHTRQVLEEISQLKNRHEKKMEIEIEEFGKEIETLEGIDGFCAELKAFKGSANEVLELTDELIRRTEELEIKHQEFFHDPTTSVELGFTDSDPGGIFSNLGRVTPNANVTNFIGKVTESTKTFGSDVIVVGANDGVSVTNDVIRINLRRSDDVSTLPQLPASVQKEAAAVACCQSVFVVGMGINRDEIWRYDPSTAAAESPWRKCCCLVRGRRRHSVVCVDRRVIYTCAGYSDSARRSLDDVEAFDPAADDHRSESVGKLVFSVQSAGNCVALESSLFIFGGRIGGGQNTGEVQVYDLTSNTCSLLSRPMPRPCRLLRAALWDRTVILIGQQNCFTYDFETDIWQTRDRFKTGVGHFGMTLDNGQVFVIGGGEWRSDSEGGGGGGQATWMVTDDVRCVPVLSILSDEPVEWKRHARLKTPSLVTAIAKVESNAPTIFSTRNNDVLGKQASGGAGVS